MCGRVYSTLNPNQLLRLAGTNLMRNQNHHQVSYNICPTTYVPAVRHHSSSESNHRELDMIKWGYHAPFGQFIINARVEEAQDKRTFKNLVNTNRCVMIVEGYFEWTPNKDPFVFRGKAKEGDDLPPHLYIAAITAPDDTLILFTREALRGFHEVHERMPLILDESEIDMWLDCEKYKFEKIIGGLLDEKKEKWSQIFYYQTGPLINNIKNKSEKVIYSVDEYKKDLDKTGIKSFFKPVKKDDAKGEDKSAGNKEGSEDEKEKEKEKNNNSKEEEKQAVGKETPTKGKEEGIPPTIESTQATQATESATQENNEPNQKTDAELAQEMAQGDEEEEKEANKNSKENSDMKVVQQTIDEGGLGKDFGGFKATKAFVYTGKEGKQEEKKDGVSKGGRGSKKRKEPTKKDELKQTRQKRTKVTK